MNNTELVYDFDELKMYFGEDYWVTDKICIHIPTIGDILEYGDTRFYAVVTTLCANTTAMRLQLWRSGIDWNTYPNFKLFAALVKAYTPNETKLLFGDLNLSWFELVHDNEKDADILINIPRDEGGEILRDEYGRLVIDNPDDLITIDELSYAKIVKYLSLVFNIRLKNEFAKNKATKEAMIWEDEEQEKIQNKKNKDKELEHSFLLPMISALVNHPGFKYKTNELKEINIYQFMDSVKRLQIYENSTALLKGSYSGMVDTSKIDKKQFDWMRSTSDM